MRPLVTSITNALTVEVMDLWRFSAMLFIIMNILLSISCWNIAGLKGASPADMGGGGPGYDWGGLGYIGGRGLKMAGLG